MVFLWISFSREKRILSSPIMIDNLAVMRTLPQASCHELRGNRAGQLAVKLDKGFRMVFEVANEPTPEKPDGGLDWTQVTAIRILQLAEDYHD
jgi:proteic killer suppression protein